MMVVLVMSNSTQVVTGDSYTRPDPRYCHFRLWSSGRCRMLHVEVAHAPTVGAKQDWTPNIRDVYK